MRTGSSDTVLIVIRGNSGSGKSSVARSIRTAYGRRGLAVIGQDVVRRDILRELDKPEGLNISLIDLMCRHVLDAGHHVVLEGILIRSRYGRMLRRLVADHAGVTCCFYLDVSFDETVRRHATRPQSADFTPDLMREWYVPRDLLPDGRETVIGEDSSLERTVERILADSRLTAAPGAAGPLTSAT
ncbi:kinase [Nonomuraea sp. MG754425]|uniref:AAA family ATPase n=1 Tax=Nonomuraea sp. MG754425 TaxID=2570319 RepID=UPI001F281C1A|nr:AAA family ATPase [Nonomuraea sp. MG754425]MCF6475651.1 kinase [Nonomuraea sp. MG754425]